MSVKVDPGFSGGSTVFIVEDDEALRDGLCNLFESIGVRTHSYGSAEACLQQLDPNATGCLMLDARLPGMTGVELQEKLSRFGIRIPVIFMTAHGDVPMVRKVLKAGAIEFLVKPFLKEDLMAAVQQAFEMDRVRRQHEGRRQSLQARSDTLTARERQVMRMVTAGYLNKQIAAELELSEITVKLHRRQVMQKMQAGSLADLAKMAAELG